MISGLLFIVNTDLANPLALAKQALLGGADSLQLRHKGIYSREIFNLACELVVLCKHFSVPLIINDRVDIAIAVSASGVHLGQTDLPIPVARKLLGPNKIIGGTASNLAEAKQALLDGADYIGVGHIFPTKTKFKPHEPLGTTVLKTICSTVDIPVVAIGGINETNIDSVCATGVKGIAVISAISHANNPLEQTIRLKKYVK